MDGNQKNMRETLLIVKKLFDGGIMFQPAIRKAHKAVDASLFAPRRNCDVGTVEEQESRYERFCDSHKWVDDEGANACSRDCPLYNAKECALHWAQMSYEAENGDGDGK